MNNVDMRRTKLLTKLGLITNLWLKKPEFRHILTNFDLKKRKFGQTWAPATNFWPSLTLKDQNIDKNCPNSKYILYIGGKNVDFFFSGWYSCYFEWNMHWMRWLRAFLLADYWYSNESSGGGRCQDADDWFSGHASRLVSLLLGPNPLTTNSINTFCCFYASHNEPLQCDSPHQTTL